MKTSIDSIKRMLAALAVLGFAAWPLQAQVIVAPNNLTSTEGNSDNGYPFSVAETMHYQQVYSASQFGNVTSGGEMVTQIAFRPDAIYGTAFTHTVGDIRIALSTTTASPGNLSTTFAANEGVNNTMVFDGTLALSSSDTGPSGGPKNFDIIISLTTPFYYNPAAGNLLMDIQNFSSGNTGGNFLVSQLDATSGNPTQVSRLWAFDASATTADNGDQMGLVTQFTFVPVPEPASTALGVLGAPLLLILRRSRAV